VEVAILGSFNPMSTTAVDYPPHFVDGLGARHLVRDDRNGELHEHLLFALELVEAPGFVVALGERVARLSGFRNACYARIGHVESSEPSDVALVSEFTHGWRLAQVLDLAERERMTVEPGTVLGLIRQLLPAVALLSQQARDVAHGALGPERVLVTPQGRLVIVEHVLGSALEALQYGRGRLWRDFRIATPPTSGLPRMGPRTDVTQVGVVALSLVLGRRLGLADFPDRLPALIDEGRDRWSRGEAAEIASPMAEWLGRALQVDAKGFFQSTFEAQAALERMLSNHRSYLNAPVVLQPLLARLPPVVPALEPAEDPPAAVHQTPPVEVDVVSAVVPAKDAPGEAELALPVETGPEPEAVAAVSPVGEPPVSIVASVEGAPVRRRGLVAALAVVTLVAVIEAGLLTVAWGRSGDGAPLTADGELVVQSRPVAARVSINGEDKGVTPLTLRLAPGSHVLQVSIGNAEPRVIPLTIRAGVQTAQYVELLNVPTTGILEIRSDPPRARVWIDGRDRGLTPLTVRDLPPGEREVVLERQSRRITQTVRVEPGSTAQLVVPIQ
jgi:hypothetical protein